MTIDRFTPDNAAIVLIDHQDMTVGWIRSQPAETTVNVVRMLARVGTELGVPLLVTSTMEDAIGTNIKDIQELAPAAYAARVKRGGTLNCFLDPHFVEAAAGLGRRNVVLAGLTTDICLFHSACGALEAGYQVQVVADGCGSSAPLSDAVTFDRLQALGATVTVGNQILSRARRPNRSTSRRSSRECPPHRRRPAPARPPFRGGRCATCPLSRGGRVGRAAWCTASA